jgi:formiminotetrahydrofolate cyclodeaminase
LSLLGTIAGTLDGLEALARRGNPSCASDLLAAAALAQAASETAFANVAANLPSVADARWTRRTRERATALRRAIARRTSAVAGRARRLLLAPAAPVRTRERVLKGKKPR